MPDDRTIVFAGRAVNVPPEPIALGQRPPFQAPLPTNLPNECLYLIVDYLCRDVRALHKLLTVSRFFFHAALPHLLHDALSLDHVIFREDEREKLFALVLASFLETRLLESSSNTTDGDGVQGGWGRKMLDDIVKPFGLKLVSSVGPARDPILTNFFASIDLNEENNRDVIELDDKDLEKNQKEDKDLGRAAFRTMTIDYSRYLTTLITREWRDLQLATIFQLRQFSEDMRTAAEDEDEVRTAVLEDGGSTETPATSTEVQGQEQEEAPDEEHEYNGGIQFEERYIWQLHESISELLLHYNGDCITSFSLEMSKAAKHLPLATKMANLRILLIDRESESLPDSHLESTISFIKQNQAAFPMKSPLDLKFTYGCWYGYMDEDEDHIPIHFNNPHINIDATANTNTNTNTNTNANANAVSDDFGDENEILFQEKIYKAKVGARRKEAFRRMKPKISLYEAVGRPSKMVVSQVPMFYDHALSIDLDRLQEFCDEDLDRIDQGEGTSMEAFLRRGKNIKELKLDVGNPDLLSWAANEALASANLAPSALSKLMAGSESGLVPSSKATSSSAVLCKLDTLSLWSDRPYRFSIHTLNDALTAFAPSLRSISMTAVNDTIHDLQYTNASKRSSFRKSLKLQNLPWANKIGDWPFLLPRLRSIELTLIRVSCVDFGSFSACPNLEELQIQVGRVYAKDCRLAGDLSPNERILLTDYRYHQQNIDMTLFPTWNLPRLKRLELHDLAAVRFDFASLEAMRRLETLNLSVDKRASTLYNTERFKAIHHEAWNCRPDAAARFNKALFLPELTTLTLSGPPAAMFYLEWLRACPKLDRLSLTIFKGEPQNILRRAFLMLPPNDPEIVEEEGKNMVTQSKTGYQDQDNSHERWNKHEMETEEDAPYLESHLSTIDLKGCWTMTEHTLTTLLTVYAPFLRELRVDRVLKRQHLSGYNFIRAIMNADEINKEFAEAALVTRLESLKIEQGATKADGGVSHPRLTEDRIPGQQLVSVASLYTVGKREMPLLRLVHIPQEEASQYKSCNMRVYTLCQQAFVSRDHRDQMRNKKSGDEGEDN